MNTLNNRHLNKFGTQVLKAMQTKGIKIPSSYDLAHYCQTLMNAASIAQLFASMACSDRLDLIDDNPDEQQTTAQDLHAEKCRAFTRKCLGLELLTHGDPRGSVFKLVVDSSIGDSFGDKTHLCVPCNDAYFCN